MTDLDKELERQREKTPAERKNYGPLFLGCSVLLIVGTLLAIVDETRVRRPWKSYQRDFQALEIAKADSQLAMEREGIAAEEMQAKLAEIDAKVLSLTAEKETPEFVEKIRRLEAADKEVDEAIQDWRFARSDSDEAYYNFQHATLMGHDASAEEARLREIEAQVAEARLLADRVTAVRDSLQKTVDDVDGRLKEILRERDHVFREVHRLERKIAEVGARPLEIQQIVLAGFDQGNFGQEVIRVDRCVTCHMGITKAEFEGDPHPFASHPGNLLDVHKPDEFGCTPCHWGQGPALDPDNAHGQAPFWERPLLEKEYISTSCLSCHARTVYLEHAETMLFAKKLALDVGCHGCHEMPFLEEMGRMGPSLRKVSAKTTPGWMGRWIKDPHAFSPATRMPVFYFSDQEVAAAVAYLASVSKEEIETTGYKSALTPPGPGDPGRGKDLVESVGCRACHVIGDMEAPHRLKEGPAFGPDLNKVGSKVDPIWLYNWLKDPKAYSPDTKMPDLRLTDGEASDVTAYLMTLTDPEYEPLALPELDDPRLVAEGKRLLRTYGCHGCHVIPGLEDEGKVSVSLGEIGEKRPEEEFDFGNRTDVAHEWEDWVFHKIKEPRGYTTERIQSKMPDFRFSDEEAKALTVLLRGFNEDHVALEYREAETPARLALNNGRWFFRRRNCIGCHEMEGHGGYIREYMEDEAMAPPVLTGEGKKVQDDWLINFLKSPFPIRPWLTARMPTFHFEEDEVTTVLEYFLAQSDLWLQLDTYDDFKPDPSLIAGGKSLFTQLQCAKCHIVGGEIAAPGLLAPSLDLAVHRLKPKWVVEWLKDPQTIQEGTMMPSFFPEGQTFIEDVLDGDVEKQIRAMRDYIYTLGTGGP